MIARRRLRTIVYMLAVYLKICFLDGFLFRVKCWRMVLWMYTYQWHVAVLEDISIVSHICIVCLHISMENNSMEIFSIYCVCITYISIYIYIGTWMLYTLLFMDNRKGCIFWVCEIIQLRCSGIYTEINLGLETLTTTANHMCGLFLIHELWV